MIHDYRYYREFLSRLKRPVFPVLVGNPSTSNSGQSLAIYMPYGLGTGPDGTILQISCGNTNAKSPGLQSCLNIGVLTCSQCALIKYCSTQCQRHHWSRHRLDCEHPYMNPGWEPEWMAENRAPLLSNSRFLPPSSSTEVYKNLGMPAYDCLNLMDNEGLGNPGKDIKICMTSAGDIRNLIRTVNNIPSGHFGKVNILLNNCNAIVVNRMLVILCILLNPGQTIGDSAEIATHLMYSGSLPEKAGLYVQHCASLIYGEDSGGSEISFQVAIKTRGRGKLYSAQPASSIKRVMEIFSSDYSLATATASMKNVFQDPFYIDDRHKLLSALKPGHRLALHRFWQTGVLAPFSTDLKTFKSPNRLMFTPQGEWMGMTSAVNPLHGWDVTAIQRSGLQSGCDPAGDILGCLFFHIKSELREFATRVKERNINIHLLQYDSRLLSKGISIGVLPEFSDASFDRVDIGDMSDQLGVAECLVDWAPLLNKNNNNSCLIMHSKKWHEESPMSIARDNPRALKILTERCRRASSIKTTLRPLFNGSQTPFSARLMSSLDAFVDHERAFLKYLDDHAAQSTGYSLGVNLRQIHCVHPKRVGIPLHLDSQKLPNLSKEEFYELFIIGGADLTIRFAEFGFIA